MSRPSATLRNAKPVDKEGIVFARYLDEIALFYRVILGRRVVEIIGKAFTQRDYDLSYQNPIFAERNGAIVGMISGHATERHRRSVGPPLREAARSANVKVSVHFR